jgi:hypothetical protein
LPSGCPLVLRPVGEATQDVGLVVPLGEGYVGSPHQPAHAIDRQPLDCGPGVTVWSHDELVGVEREDKLGAARDRLARQVGHHPALVVRRAGLFAEFHRQILPDEVLDDGLRLVLAEVTENDQLVEQPRVVAHPRLHDVDLVPNHGDPDDPHGRILGVREGSVSARGTGRSRR